MSDDRDPTHSSKVVRLRAQIDAEYQAAYNGLYGLSAGSARHDFIQKRMERVAQIGEQLIAQIDKEEALSLDQWNLSFTFLLQDR